jgi:hypothetical protein
MIPPSTQKLIDFIYSGKKIVKAWQILHLITNYFDFSTFHTTTACTQPLHAFAFREDSGVDPAPPTKRVGMLTDWMSTSESPVLSFSIENRHAPHSAGTKSMGDSKVS